MDGAKLVSDFDRTDLKTVTKCGITFHQLFSTTFNGQCLKGNMCLCALI